MVKLSECIDARCARCGSERGDHEAKSLRCPRKYRKEGQTAWLERTFKWDGKATGIIKRKKKRKTIEERFQDAMAKKERE